MGMPRLHNVILELQIDSISYRVGVYIIHLKALKKVSAILRKVKIKNFVVVLLFH